MVPHSLTTPYSDSGSRVLWEDDERVLRRGWRQDDDGERRAVLFVVPAAEHPSRSSLDRFRHEYELRVELDGAWAVQPLTLVREAGRIMLVLEDPGGEPLERLLGAPMEMGCFLRLAIAIAVTVGKLHQRGLVHKDIKPANILANQATGEVRLTGFGIASLLPRERQSPRPPETLAGTLAYMAPEQTGRMNRSVDSRSDLYALGITLYRMLTGTLPFAATEPMEWVHCHLARCAVPPAERLGDIPAAVSAIVMKLLAKSAEDRYQTAAGLERDLLRCQSEWETRRRIDEFRLGERDSTDRLLIPEKLYGRQGEVETLLGAFNRIAKGGPPELILVSGYSGIGKSSVVNELQPVLVLQRGLFASGKFDQSKRDVPYSTLAQAFQSLIRPLLSRNQADLAPWQDALREALGPNAKLIVELVPAVKLMIGEPPQAPELPPQDAQRRFRLVFRRLIGVFARPEHPLALFLDDLQWLDAATLDVLGDLLTCSDLQHLLLIGAYRDNEVDAAHPLIRKLEALRSAGGKVEQISLAPLAGEHVVQLIADSLHCEPERGAPLGQLVHEKTGGNPFFAIQFIHSLVEEGMLAFHHDVAHGQEAASQHSPKRAQGEERRSLHLHGQDPALRPALVLALVGVVKEVARDDRADPDLLVTCLRDVHGLVDKLPAGRRAVRLAAHEMTRRRVCGYGRDRDDHVPERMVRLEAAARADAEKAFDVELNELLEDDRRAGTAHSRPLHRHALALPATRVAEHASLGVDLLDVCEERVGDVLRPERVAR